MRRGAAGLAASLGLALLAFCSPAFGAKHKPREVEGELPVRIAGSVVITWHGDPARGCAAAGVCDVAGSVTYKPGDPSFVGELVDGRRFFPEFIALFDFEGPAVVRVRRDPPGRTPSRCLDTVQTPSMSLAPTPMAGGKYRFDFQNNPDGGSDLSSGRCAGPVGSDLRGNLPSGVLDVRALRRGSSLINMSGRQSFVGGPYSGQVVSTVGIRVARLSRFGHGDDGGGFSFTESHTVPSRQIRILELGAQYRITGLSGSLTNNFQGALGPLCAGLDACDTSGTISYSPAFVGGRATLAGFRKLRTGEHPSLRSALAQLHAGRLSLGGDVQLRPGTVARVSETIARPDEATCNDSTTQPFAAFDVFGAAGALQVRLGRPDGSVTAIDGFRTRCPGPSQLDTLARGSLAGGALRRARIGAKRLTIQLSRPGTFDAGAYTGTRAGSLTLTMVRTKVRMHVFTEVVPG